MNRNTPSNHFRATLERQMIDAAFNEPAPFSGFETIVFASVIGTCGILVTLLFHRL